MITIRHEWNLHNAMGGRGIHKISALGPLLEGYGIHLSRSQIHRLVTQRPERMNMDVLAALLGILDCDISDVWRPIYLTTEAATGTNGERVATNLTRLIREQEIRPVRARITNRDPE